MDNKNTTPNLPKGIYFSSKPVPFNDALSKNSKYYGAEHALLIKSDGKGNHRVIRGGPVNYRGGENFVTGGSSRIEGEIDKPIQESLDRIKDEQDLKSRSFKKINIPDKDIDKEW